MMPMEFVKVLRIFKSCVLVNLDPLPGEPPDKKY